MKKSTEELLNQLKNSRNYTAYLDANRTEISGEHMQVCRAVTAVLSEKKLKKADVIARSGLEQHYAYQILSGVKKNPTRDKLIMLCIGMGLQTEEVQRLLKVTGYAQLYPRNARDNVLLFAFAKRLSVIETNELLSEQKQELLL